MHVTVHEAWAIFIAALGMGGVAIFLMVIHEKDIRKERSRIHPGRNPSQPTQLEELKTAQYTFAFMLLVAVFFGITAGYKLFA